MLTPKPHEYVKLVIEEVKKSKIKENIIISSFDWRILKEIENQSPEISRGYLTYEQEIGIKIKKMTYDKSPWMNFLSFPNNGFAKIFFGSVKKFFNPIPITRDVARS